MSLNLSTDLATSRSQSVRGPSPGERGGPEEGDVPPFASVFERTGRQDALRDARQPTDPEKGDTPSSERSEAMSATIDETSSDPDDDGDVRETDGLPQVVMGQPKPGGIAAPKVRGTGGAEGTPIVVADAFESEPVLGQMSGEVGTNSSVGAVFSEPSEKALTGGRDTTIPIGMTTAAVRGNAARGIVLSGTPAGPMPLTTHSGTGADADPAVANYDVGAVAVNLRNNRINAYSVQARSGVDSSIDTALAGSPGKSGERLKDGTIGTSGHLASAVDASMPPRASPKAPSGMAGEVGLPANKTADPMDLMNFMTHDKGETDHFRLRAGHGASNGSAVCDVSGAAATGPAAVATATRQPWMLVQEPKTASAGTTRDRMGSDLGEAGFAHGTTYAPSTVPEANRFQPDHTLARAAVRQICETVHANGPGRSEVALNPHELGGVRLRMQGDDVSIHVVMTVERPETLDLIRRNTDILLQEFTEQGYRNVTFGFDYGSQDTDRGAQDRGTAANTGPAEQENIPSEQASRMSLDGLLDLRL